MEGFLHIVNKKRNDLYNHIKIERIINDYKNLSHNFNIINNEKITSIYYTNEYKVYPYSMSSHFLFCPVGQFSEEKLNIQSKLMTLGNGEINNYVSGLGGAFALSISNLITNTVDIYTHVVRAESVFIYEDSSRIIVGTDPLIVSVFSNDSLKPTLDFTNFISFFEQGYFADENTPFKKVVSLPPNSHISIKDSVKINDIDSTYSEAFTYSLSDTLFKEIETNFLNSFNILPTNSRTVKTGLTGGKDSRLLVLALLERGYEVRSHTRGLKNHPDVIVAEHLAKSLNISHEINESILNENNDIDIDLEKRFKDTIIPSSGLITAYDNITTSNTFKRSEVLDGVGASVLTGGFNKFKRSNLNSISESLKKPLYKFSNFYHDDNNKYSKFLDEFSHCSDNLDELFHLFFLMYRTGRWTSDSRLAKSYANSPYSIYLDNQLTKSVMRLNIKDLRKELIHYKLINQLNPEVINIPFYRYRFAFEEDGPQSPSDYKNWLKREPIYAKSKVDSYNWRSLGNNDENLIKVMKNLILSNKNNAIFDILDYKGIEKLLDSKLTNRPTKFIWSIASQIYFTEYLTDKNNKPLPKLILKTSNDKIVQEKVPSKLIDLSEEYSPLNKSLIMENNNIKYTGEKGNQYIKTFSGNFDTVPTSFNLKKAKKIRIDTNLTISESSDVKMIVIFYNDFKRFKTKSITEKKIKDTNITFNELIDIPKYASYFRVAVHFKKINTENQILNYSYVELKY